MASKTLSKRPKKLAFCGDDFPLCAFAAQGFHRGMAMKQASLSQRSLPNA
jgi:hypothetical protein